MGSQYGFNKAPSAGRWAWFDKQLFPVYEAQFSVMTARADRLGNSFTPNGERVIDWLRARDIQPVSYIHPFWVSRPETVGYPPIGREGPDEDPYWFWFQFCKVVHDNDWFVRCVDGSVSYRFQANRGGMAPVDVTRSEVREWIVEALETLREDRDVLFVDVGFWSYEAYARCSLLISEDDLREAQFKLYDELRANGWRVIVNAAWAPANYLEAPEHWIYPAMSHIDGVVVENEGHVFVDNRWLGITDARRRAMAQSWLSAGKKFLVVATYNDVFGFSDFTEYARYHYNEAISLNYRVAINSVNVKDQTPWYDWLYVNEIPDFMFPVDVPELTFEEYAWQLADEAHCIDINPSAALFNAIVADGFVPTSPEFSFEWKGQLYVGQRADALSNAVVDTRSRLYVVRYGDWSNVKFIYDEV